MKPNHLFNSLLVVAVLTATSCSVPQMAQKTSGADDDVYGSTASAVEYTRPAPVQSSQSVDDYNDDEDYYGSSDLYADMSYASRIDRFYYGSPFRGYYDPFYYDSFYGYSPYYSGIGLGWGSGFGWGGGFGLGLGFGYGGYGGLYSPWGWGGGYYGGLWGGGLWGGSYANRYNNYKPRTGRGNENITYGRGNYNGNGSRSYNSSGSVIQGRRSQSSGGRASQYGNSRTPRSMTQPTTRPNRTQSYTPQRSSEGRSYSPPASSGNFGGGGRSSGGGGGRGGRGN